MTLNYDFKKAFDRVWHGTLVKTMRNYYINASITQAIENLNNKDKSTKVHVKVQDGDLT